MKPNTELKDVMELWICKRKSVWTNDTLAFVSEDAMMKYFQAKYPKKKSLRFMQGGHNKFYLVNHNSHVAPYAGFDIRKVSVWA